MLMTAVTGIDDRNRRIHRSHPGSAFLIVTHGNDVGIAAHYPDSIRYGFALAHRGAGCGGEALHLAAQTEHSRLKAQAGTGTGLIEQGSQDLAAAAFRIGSGVPDDVVSQVQNPVDLSYTQVGGINQMTHR